MHLPSPARNSPDRSLHRPTLLSRPGDYTRAQKDRTLEPDRFNILFDLALHPYVCDRRVFVRPAAGNQHVDFCAGFVGCTREFDVQPMFDFILVFEPARCALGRREGREEDVRRGR